MYLVSNSQWSNSVNKFWRTAWVEELTLSGRADLSFLAWFAHAEFIFSSHEKLVWCPAENISNSIAPKGRVDIRARPSLFVFPLVVHLISCSTICHEGWMHLKFCRFKWRVETSWKYLYRIWDPGNVRKSEGTRGHCKNFALQRNATGVFSREKRNPISLKIPCPTYKTFKSDFTLKLVPN